MNPLDLTRICRLAPYKDWTEDGRDYYVETSRGQIFDIGDALRHGRPGL